MQKKLIALAVAGLASAGAFAQSNVTIYGVADGSFESVSANGASSGTGYASRTRIATNSSLIGFKGTEDLGNGLKAMFQVENQISLDGPGANTTNSQSMGNGWNTRDTFVGLTGDFGAVLAGYISTPQRSTAAKYDLMPGATGSGSSLNMIGRVNLGGVAQGALGTTNNFGESTAVGGGQSVTNNVGTIFRSQALAYVTPVFNGFNGVIAYVPNENRDNTATGTGYKRNQYGWNAAANYANGPINVSLAYLKLNDIGAISAIGGAGAPFSGDQNHTNWLFGASYDLSPSTKVSFMYDNFKGKLGLSAGGEVEVKRNAFYLAGKQSFGANEIILALPATSAIAVPRPGRCAWPTTSASAPKLTPSTPRSRTNPTPSMTSTPSTPWLPPVTAAVSVPSTPAPTRASSALASATTSDAGKARAAADDRSRRAGV